MKDFQPNGSKKFPSKIKEKERGVDKEREGMEEEEDDGEKKKKKDLIFGINENSD